jgi:hypothetical protein
MKIVLPKILIGTKQNKYFLNHIKYLYCMVSLLEYLPIITSGLLALSILTLVLGRKNLRLQSEYQIYARMIEARVRLESTESFARMAKESPYYAERLRWASGARAMKSIPKFQAVWNKTKNVHTRDFVNFIDSL